MDHHPACGLIDAHHRQVDYLRISVTDRCNLRCRYCAPSSPPAIRSDARLALDEIHRLVTIAVGLGIAKVRLTGGEPLCRSGLADLIARIRADAGVEDIAITTNGTMLARKANALKKAGLKRINLSLDTLNRERFHALTGVDQFQQVWAGIDAAVDAGFDPVKINTVVMRGFNDDEIEALASLSLQHPLHVRFIEYMPIGTDPQAAARYFMSIDEIRERLSHLGVLRPIARKRLDGPARRYRFDGAPGEIGLIGSMSNHFCGTCNRLRLTADGHLRACLLADDQLDIKTPLRAGASDAVLASLFRRTIQHKHAAHRMRFNGDQQLQTKMVSIGG